MGDYEIVETFYEENYGMHYQVIRVKDGEIMSGEECSLDDCEQLIDELRGA